MADKFLWWRDGVIYQIYPRSFADSNGDGIGDLQGIISRLDYLADLGVDAIWLSPINPSPDKDFGYDVADYKDIDLKFGTMTDFSELVEKAHQRGIHIIMDMVMNHTSDQHRWFLESRSSLTNPKRNWYIWCENPRGKQYPPNNWQSVFGGRAWEFDETTGQYYYHMFTPQQPDLNWHNPEVREEMMDTFRFWAERGVDGFRLDVFNAYFKDDQFRDNPYKPGIRPFDWQIHRYDTNLPEMMGVVQEIRNVLDAYPERYVVGETFLGGYDVAAGYCGPERLHAAFNFSMLRTLFTPAGMLTVIRNWEKALPEGAWPNYVLNNHDVPRSATRYLAGKKDQVLKVAAAMLLTLRGTPFLYYGEEIGMRDILVSRAEIKDPVGKRYWPIPVGRDGCRSPMQWSPDPGAGFTNSQPWLKIHRNHRQRNVVEQAADPNSLLNFYKSLLRLRKVAPALQKGDFTPLTTHPIQVLAYLRKHGEQTILVALNFSPLPAGFKLPTGLGAGTWRPLLSSKEHAPEIVPGKRVLLKGFEAVLWELETDE